MYRTVAGREVGKVGFGCMGLSWAYGGYDSPTRRVRPSLSVRGAVNSKVAVIRHALACGANLLDTADVYGPFVNEELVGAALVGRREDAVVATKVGLVNTEHRLRNNGRPEHIRAACVGSLRRLGVECIDIYQLHRVDPAVPLSETWGAMSMLVDEGKVRGIGLCEVTVPQLVDAAAIHPVATVQSELSVWCRDALDDVVPWCEQNGTAFIAYAPLGRGFLTGALTAHTKLAEGDFRSSNPRFTEEARAANAPIVETISAIAGDRNATPAQVALAWVSAVSEATIPIPGTTKISRIDENMGSAHLALTDAEVLRLSSAPTPDQARY